MVQEIGASNHPEKASDKVDMDALKKDIELYPDGYQHERAKRLGCTRGGIYHALKRLRVSYKKNVTVKGSAPFRARFLGFLDFSIRGD
jgi:hypothetical protein